MATSDTTACATNQETFGQRLLQSVPLTSTREIQLRGTAGLDLSITRHFDEIEIRPVHHSGLMDLEGVDRLELVLDVLREEIIALTLREAGKPAIAHCQGCGDKIFVESYEDGQDYWCLEQDTKKCIAEITLDRNKKEI